MKFAKGNIPWNKGNRGSFKGISYGGLHDWVKRNKGEPRYCEVCGCTDAKVFEWSNISGTYKPLLSDWQRLCRKCHTYNDYIQFGSRKALYEKGTKKCKVNLLNSATKI